MPKKSHYSSEDDYKTGYSLGTYASATGEEYDYGEQDAAAREAYEALEGHDPDCSGCEYCRLVSDFDTFNDGFSSGYTTEYERRHK